MSPDGWESTDHSLFSPFLVSTSYSSAAKWPNYITSLSLTFCVSPLVLDRWVYQSFLLWLQIKVDENVIYLNTKSNHPALWNYKFTASNNSLCIKCKKYWLKKNTFWGTLIARWSNVFTSGANFVCVRIHIHTQSCYADCGEQLPVNETSVSVTQSCQCLYVVFQLLLTEGRLWDDEVVGLASFPHWRSSLKTL